MGDRPPLRIVRAEAFATERVLRRDRLTRWFTDLTDPSLVFVSGPFGMGKSTLLRDWAAHGGIRPLRLDLAGAMTSTHVWNELATTLGSGTKVTLSIRHPDVEVHRPALRELAQLRSRFPSLQIIMLGGVGWRTRKDGDLRELTPTAVLQARELCFRVPEITELARIRGLVLEPRTVRRIRDWTGGYPLAVDRMLTAWSHHGQWEGAAEEAVIALADALAGAVEVEPLHNDMWESLLLSSVPEVFDHQLLAQLLDQVESPQTTKTLEAAGLVTMSHDTQSGPQFAYLPAVRAALRRRAGVELDVQRRDRAIALSVEWLAGQGQIASALDLAESHGDRSRLRALLRVHWPELGEFPAAGVRALMGRIGNQMSQERSVLIGHARAITDVTHAGHVGRISGAERDYATLLLDQAAKASTGPDSDPHADAAIETARAALARTVGRHKEALRRHRGAIEGLLHSPHDALVPSVRTQAGLTALSLGDYEDAANEFTYAYSAGTVGQQHTARYARDLAALTSRLMDEPGPSGYERPAAQSPASRFPAQLECALHALNQVELGSVWEHLKGLPDQFGDPTILHVLRRQIEGQAHSLSGTQQAGLESLDLLEAGAGADGMSGYERTVLLLTRAELMAASGATSEALALLPREAEPAAMTAVDMVRAKLLLALGEPDRALTVVAPHAQMRPGSDTRYRIWCLVLTALAHSDQGADELANDFLRRSLVLASRSRNLLPFARQGIDRLGALIKRIESLYLEPESQHLVDTLTGSWRRLRGTSLRINLTQRESVLLQYLAQSSMIRTAARELHVSPNTVKTQLRSIYRKLGVSSREDALAAAAYHGLLSAGEAQGPSGGLRSSPVEGTNGLGTVVP